MKRIINKMLVFLIAMLLSFSMVACNLSGNNTPPASADSYTYVSMRINPHIEIVADDSGTVVSVNAVNEDGEIVLLELDLIGLNLEEASELFTDKAIELGYLNLTDVDATVYINVEGDNKKFIDKQKQKIESELNEFFKTKGKFGKVSQEVLVDEQLQIIERVKQMYPELTEEEVLELTVQEMIDLIKNYQVTGSNICANLREEYNLAVAELKDTYMVQIEELRQSIKELEVLLRAEDKDTDAYVQILEQLDELYETLEDLWDEQREALDNLKEEYREKENEQKDSWRNELEERKAHFKEYYDYLKGDKGAEDDDSLKDEIKDDLEEEFKDKFSGIFDDFQNRHQPEGIPDGGDQRQ